MFVLSFPVAVPALQKLKCVLQDENAVAAARSTAKGAGLSARRVAFDAKTPGTGLRRRALGDITKSVRNTPAGMQSARGKSNFTPMRKLPSLVVAEDVEDEEPIQHEAVEEVEPCTGVGAFDAYDDR